MHNITKLQKLAKKWGGEVKEVDVDEFEKICERRNFYRAPFTYEGIGILWPGKIIFCGQVHWASIIHEMGHVFACKKKPLGAEELSFHGWEYLVAKYIKASITEWFKENEDYNINDNGHEFGQLSRYKRDKYMKEAVALSKEKGLIGRKNKPLSIYERKS